MGGRAPAPRVGPEMRRGYRDRAEAGAELAAHLGDVDGDALIMAIPRGGIGVAAEVARVLGAELDVAVARKVGHPYNPELAVGAVGGDGIPMFDERMLARMGLDRESLAATVEAEAAEVARREAAYRGDRPPPRVEGRTVVVVDDGVATGATMKAVLRQLRRANPARLICAVPCGPPETIAELAAECDEVVCPLQPAYFAAVGQWYDDFHQMTDDEVRAALAQ